jgi:hypothetical protein
MRRVLVSLRRALPTRRIVPSTPPERFFRLARYKSRVRLSSCRRLLKPFNRPAGCAVSVGPVPMGHGKPVFCFRSALGCGALRRTAALRCGALLSFINGSPEGSPAAGKGRIKTRRNSRAGRSRGMVVAGPPSTSSQSARDRPNAVIRSVRAIRRVRGAGEPSQVGPPYGAVGIGIGMMEPQLGAGQSPGGPNFTA